MTNDTPRSRSVSTSVSSSERPATDGVNGEAPWEPWTRRAEELADWVMATLVVRWDRYGIYVPGKDGKALPYWSRLCLNRETIVAHFRARDTTRVIGLATTVWHPVDGLDAGVSLVRALCLEIDRHGDGPAPEVTLAAALVWYHRLVELGFRPLLVDSNGRGGYHLRVIFDQLITAAHARRFALWLMRDWAELGLPSCPEAFPKQDMITAQGDRSCGNWLRILARHHTRDHWSTVWDGTEFVAGDDAIDIIVSIRGDSPKMIPAEALVFGVEKTRKGSAKPRTDVDLDRNARLAREALTYLGKGVKDANGQEFFDAYDPWIVIGMSLRELGDVGLALWLEWSEQHPKYQPTGKFSCEEKWPTFGPQTEGSVRLGTLFHYAKAAGWEGPRRESEVETPKAETPSNNSSSRRRDDPEVNEASDDPHCLARIHLKECEFKGQSTRQFYRGEMLEWQGGAYRALAEAEAQSRLTRSIKAEFDRLNVNAIKLWEERSGKSKDGTPEPKPQARKVTRSIVSNVTLAMESMTLLPGRIEAPAWINDRGPFDASNVIPFRNALVHLPSFVTDSPKAIVKPTPSYFCPYVLDYDFTATAPPTPEFDQFLTSIWPHDPESVATLLEFLGYLLAPDTSHQKILLLIGPKRSGRGTIGRLIRALIGPANVAAPTLEGMADSFGMASLIGKPVAIIGDARVSPRSPHHAAIVERLLGISGEDTCTIPRKYLPDWTGKLPTRLVILSNDLPQLPDPAEALASRYLVLRFTESFIGREDKQLDAKLLAELPGILLKAIEGWKRLRDRGHFLQPDSGQSDCDQLRDISSPVGAYVRERLILGEGFSEDVARTFEDWCAWCELKRRKSGDEASFGRHLRSVVPTLVTKPRRRKRGEDAKAYIYVFHGLRLREPADPPPDWVPDEDESEAPVARNSSRESDIAQHTQVPLPLGDNSSVALVARNFPELRTQENTPLGADQKGQEGGGMK
jgi:putative DNA primase/helicase